MKIRTDFVTNSSSYSSAEIMIENPVLLDILARYRDEGIFDVDYLEVKIGCGEFMAPPGVNLNDYLPEEKLGFSKTPAIYCFIEEGGLEPPCSLDEMISSIIELIKYDDPYQKIDEQALAELEEELIQKKEDIKQSYSKVFWEYYHTTNEEHGYPVNGSVNKTTTFLFDQKNGERNRFVAKNDETGEILEER